MLTSSWEEPRSNPNPEKASVLGSEFRENRKAGDLVSEVPWRGGLAGLKLKMHQWHSSHRLAWQGFFKSDKALRKWEGWGRRNGCHFHRGRLGISVLRWRKSSESLVLFALCLLLTDGYFLHLDLHCLLRGWRSGLLFMCIKHLEW